jgi:hypothetical protein
MKKIILFILLSTCIAPVYAQTSVGVIGGYNLSFVYPESNWTAWQHHASEGSGWRAGLIADQHLWKKFYLQPQLIFNQKGYNYSYTAEAPSYDRFDYKRHLLYLELQANLLFKPQIGNGKLVLGAGPYIGRGISGRERIDIYHNDQDGQHYILDYNVIKYKNKYPPFDLYYTTTNVTYIKPYDIGVNLLGGYELKNGLFFNITYSLGLNNTDYHIKSFNGYLGVTVGYFLKRFS